MGLMKLLRCIPNLIAPQAVALEEKIVERLQGLACIPGQRHLARQVEGPSVQQLEGGSGVRIVQQGRNRVDGPLREAAAGRIAQEIVVE